MDESVYHLLSKESINIIIDRLEEADQSGALEMEYEGGILTLDLPSGRQLLLSKHTASRQLWLSSPLSGGLHFSHDGKGWTLADGRRLEDVLSQELKQLAQIDVTFP